MGAICHVYNSKIYLFPLQSVQRKKNLAIDKALDHFDEFYGNVFGEQWASIRAGLLAKQKYAVVVNNYSDSESVIANLESRGALNIRTLFNLQKQYNAEKDAKRRKQKLAEKIEELDRKLEEKEAQYIAKTDEACNASLEKQLAQAELDNTRLVDPKNVSSTELLHQYVPATKIKGREDWIPESDHYK